LQLVKIHSAFHGTLRFITALTYKTTHKIIVLYILIFKFLDTLKNSRYRPKTLISRVPIHCNHSNTSPQTCTAKHEDGISLSNYMPLQRFVRPTAKVSSLTDVITMFQQLITSRRREGYLLHLLFGWDTKHQTGHPLTLPHTLHAWSAHIFPLGL